MKTPNQPPDLPAVSSANDTAQRDAAPLSLGRLRDAFAQMLGAAPHAGSPSSAKAGSPAQPETTYTTDAPSAYLCEISPRSVVEAMLFVGRPDNWSFSSRELAVAMRGVSPGEIDAAVTELNAIYDNDRTPYRIDGSHAGYRLVLREEFERMRDKFYGRVREAKLSPSAVEVLSIIAYNQPATVDEINELRGAPSGAALATLVRRRLVRLERAEEGGTAQYWTTDRFLRLFGLENLAALPRSEELEKA